MKNKIQRLSILTILMFFSCNTYASLYDSLQDRTKPDSIYQLSLKLEEKFLFDSALTNYKLGYSVALDFDNTIIAARCINRIQEIYLRKGDFSNSKKYIDEFDLKVAHLLKPDHPEFINRLRNQATYYLRNGVYDSAKLLLSKALDRSLENGNYSGLGSIYSQFANVHLVNLEYAKAEEYFQKAINTKESARTRKDSVAVNSDYGNIGILYGFYLNDYEKAIYYLKRAAVGYEDNYGESHLNTASLYYNIGAVYENFGKPDLALEYCIKAKRIFSSRFGENHYAMASVNNTLGNVYLEKKNYDEADKHFKKALNIHETAQRINYSNLVMVNNNLGLLNISTKNFDKALDYLSRSLDLKDSVRASDAFSFSDVFRYRSEIYLETGNYQKALINIDSAINILSFDKGNSSESFSHYKQMNNYYYKGYIYSSSFKDNKVLDNLFKAKEQYQNAAKQLNLLVSKTSEIESIKTLRENAYKISSEAIKANYTLYKKSGDRKYLVDNFDMFEFYKSGILKYQYNDLKFQDQLKIPKEILIKEKELNQEIASLQSAIINEDNLEIKADLTDSLSATQVNKSLLLDSIRINFPKYHQIKYQTNTVKLAEVQQGINEDVLLVEYFETENTIYAFSITNNDWKFHEVKIDSVEKNMISEFNNLFRDREIDLNSQDFYTHYVKLAKEIYHIVLSPLINSHSNSNIRKLKIIPDGKLSYIPFESLIRKAPQESVPNFRDLNYLIKDYIISYDYSSTILFQNLNTKPNRAEFDILAFAPYYKGLTEESSIESGVFRNALVPLKWNTQEAKFAASVFDGEYLINNQATEAAFKDVIDKYKILHLSMHALIDDENPMNTKLAFTPSADSVEDGYLYTFELYGMRLNADLIALSACNTGYGELQRGEGIMSLARAFSYTGVPSVLTSHWQVDDKIAYEITRRFYENLSQGLNKDESLRNAKLDYLAQANTVASNPFYWNSFFIIGNNTPMEFDKSSYWIYWLSSLVIVLLILIYRVTRKRTKTKLS